MWRLGDYFIMQLSRSATFKIFVSSFLGVIFLLGSYYLIFGGSVGVLEKKIILSLSEYDDAHLSSIWQKLYSRIEKQPFNLVASLLFLGAILHTFFAHRFTVLSNTLKEYNIRHGRLPANSFRVEILHLLGEVEVVFGIWVIPLLATMTYTFSWNTAIYYLEKVSYLEAMFVVVIMAVSSSGPILQCAEKMMGWIARMGGGSISAWWWTILTVGPLSGSLITEPGAMTISAFLLAQQFYEYRPKRRFAYATLGLLFTNVSVGGVLTSFAAPPVLMVSKGWEWDSQYMLHHFGWKALLGILCSNTLYYFIFRKDFHELEMRRSKMQSHSKRQPSPVPLWIIGVHLAFLVWIVIHNHYPVIFLGTFLLFLGFYQATLFYQKRIELKPAILVGLFLAGLVVHGNLQAWWLQPVLEKASHEALLLISIALTSFNDNAAITFLATLVPDFTEAMKYAIVAGAVTGGGLTVIANAPNPTGQSILGKYFNGSISSLFLFCAAFFPTLFVAFIFYVFAGVPA